MKNKIIIFVFCAISICLNAQTKKPTQSWAYFESGFSIYGPNLGLGLIKNWKIDSTISSQYSANYSGYPIYESTLLTVGVGNHNDTHLMVSCFRNRDFEFMGGYAFNNLFLQVKKFKATASMGLNVGYFETFRSRNLLVDSNMSTAVDPILNNYSSYYFRGLRTQLKPQIVFSYQLLKNLQISVAGFIMLGQDFGKVDQGEYSQKIRNTTFHQIYGYSPQDFETYGTRSRQRQHELTDKKAIYNYGGNVRLSVKI